MKEIIHPNQTTIYDFLPVNKCNYAIKDELEDYYCCNDKCDKCTSVVFVNDCKECNLFESNQK